MTLHRGDCRLQLQDDGTGTSGIWLVRHEVSVAVTASTCDFIDNDPEDVYHLAGGSYNYGLKASFTCDETGCY